MRTLPFVVVRAGCDCRRIPACIKIQIFAPFRANFLYIGKIFTTHNHPRYRGCSSRQSAGGLAASSLARTIIEPSGNIRASTDIYPLSRAPENRRFMSAFENFAGAVIAAASQQRWGQWAYLKRCRPHNMQCSAGRLGHVATHADTEHL